LLTDITVNAKISDSNYTLELVSRNGTEYTFGYSDITTQIDMYNSLRVCTVILLSTLADKLSSESISYPEYLKKLLPNINVLNFENNDENNSDAENNENNEDNDNNNALNEYELLAQ